MHYWGEFTPAVPRQRPRVIGYSRRAIVAGGSGLVGTAICKELVAAGFEVIVLSRAGRDGTRRPPPCAGCEVVEWDGETAGRWAEEIDRRTVLINLAGENPGATLRWSEQTKALILGSRLAAIRAFEAAIQASVRRGQPPPQLEHLL